jgi:ATP synthase protein I
MAPPNAPEKPDRDVEPGINGRPGEGGDLESRRKSLDAALAGRQPSKGASTRDPRTSGGTGFANALRLSSEFIAGVLVGAGIGYLIDRFAGTAPWGMIVFLLLGFVAGVLNVLRSAGLVAEPDRKVRPGDMRDDNEK